MKYVSIIDKNVTVTINRIQTFMAVSQLLKNSNMKHIKSLGLIVLLFLTFPLSAHANLGSADKLNDTKEVSAEARILINRLEEIKALDKSDMTSTEKKALRKEVRSIKQSLKEVGGGVYLSVGAIIIIVLLLILLL